ncbi:MAG: acyltransferase family protein [Caulobacteraceae bacterium]
MSRAPDRRMFYTIDGLRGIAALLVVCRHIVPLHGGKLNFQSSYLAVEMFFLFSGFVIAHAYDKRFDAGMRFGEFFKARMLRLYPLYFLGFVIAVLTIPMARMMGIRTWPLDSRVIVPNLLMLPTYITFAGGVLFPFNNPSWTLFFELLANFAYCLVYKGLTNGRLALTVIVAGVLLAFSAYYFGNLDIGYNQRHFIAASPGSASRSSPGWRSTASSWPAPARSASALGADGRRRGAAGPAGPTRRGPRALRQRLRHRDLPAVRLSGHRRGAGPDGRQAVHPGRRGVLRPLPDPRAARRGAEPVLHRLWPAQGHDPARRGLHRRGVGDFGAGGTVLRPSGQALADGPDQQTSRATQTRPRRARAPRARSCGLLGFPLAPEA